VGTGALARSGRAKLGGDHMSYYERNLPHIQADDRFHLLTFSTYERGILPNWARDIVLRCCLYDHNTRYDLNAAIVMPDHVHLILWPLVDHQKSEVISLQNITQAIKSASAHAINKYANRCGPVWQDESFDHVIRKGYWFAKTEYLLENPVRKGLVQSWDMYKWSWCTADTRERMYAARELRSR
jgi:REP element-mobilizing transposase RayT